MFFCQSNKCIKEIGKNQFRYILKFESKKIERERGRGLETQSDGNNPCMTFFATQSAQRLAVLGTYSQETLSINPSKNIAFEIMVSICHEKSESQRWLMTVNASDSTITHCQSFKTASFIPPRIPLASNSSIECPTI